MIQSSNFHWYYKWGPVKVVREGRRYYIDYAFVSDQIKIAIETDGHQKFKEGGKSYFQRFLKRKNDLEALGFKVYHLTWDDVTQNQGEVALKVLSEVIFEIMKKSNSNEISTLQHEKLLDSKLKDVMEAFDDKLADTKTNSLADVYQAIRELGEQISASQNNPSEVLDSGLGLADTDAIRIDIDYPQPRHKPANNNGLFLFAIISAIAVLVVVILIVWRPLLIDGDNKPVTQEAERLNPATHNEQVKQSPSLIYPSSTQKLLPMTRVTKKSQPVTVNQSPEEAVKGPEPVESVTFPKPASRSLVLYNAGSGIYHQPECAVAKTCKSCVTLTLDEAKELGGRPSKICDIPH